MAQETDLRMMAVPVTPEDLPRELEAEGGASSATSRTSKKRRPSMEMVGPRPLVVAEQPDPLVSERSLSSPPRPVSATGRPSSSSSPRADLRGMLTRASSSGSRRGSHDSKTKAALSAASSEFDEEPKEKPRRKHRVSAGFSLAQTAGTMGAIRRMSRAILGGESGEGARRKSIAVLQPSHKERRISVAKLTSEEDVLIRDIFTL